VVADNPLDHISNLRKLEMVFKEGKLVDLEKDEGQASFWELYFIDR
jgi:leucyl aminopeptidase (aminopeptidase T)